MPRASHALPFVLVAAVVLPGGAVARQVKGPASIVFEGQRQMRGVTHWDVYLVRPDGSGFRRLTSGGTLNGDPAWSPEGDRIAFVSNGRSRSLRASELYVMRADGTHRMRVTRNSIREQLPSWSPDGKQIAFVRPDGLWLMSAAGRRIHRIVNAQIYARPTWSPDGLRIAFQSGGSRFAPSQIDVVSVTGGKPREITSLPHGATAPSWAPDGSRIAFGGEAPNGRLQVFTMQPDGSDITQLTAVAGSASGPEWASDGSGLVFVLSGGALAVVRADGSNEHKLISRRGIEFAEPDW